MPLIRGTKRRFELRDDNANDDDASSQEPPEPALHRRRTATANESDDEAYGDDAAGATAGDTSLDQMVKKLVRLALACEYQRRPIRRAEIGEKVLGGASRQFKAVFNEAQLQLRTVFGMEMVELPAREKVTLAQRRAAKSQSQQSKSAAPWVLISILPVQFRDPDIMPPPAVPTAAEESKYVSIYTVLISLISLSGGSLPDAKWQRYLRRVQMEDNTPVDGFEKTEKLLKRLERDGYVLKIKESTGMGEDDVHWVVGPRGKVEVGEEGVRGLTKAVYGELGESEDEELERKIARSLGIGEKPAARKEPKQNGGKKKRRRGRPKKDDGEEEEQDEEEEEDDDGDGSEDE